MPEHAAQVWEAVNRVRAGESLYQIVTRWNRAGNTTEHGAYWNEKVLGSLLRSPALKGVRTYHPLRPDGARTPTAEVVTQENWSPILDAETWDEVVGILDARRAKIAGQGLSTKRVMPFSGLTRCGRCGHKMRKKGPKYVCEHHSRGGCARAINATEVQAHIEEVVLAAFAGIDLTGTAQRSGRGEKVTSLRQRLAADREALERLDDDHYDGLIDRATWSRQRNRIMDRLALIQREYEQALPVLPSASVNMSTIAAELGGRTAAWKHEVTKLVLECVHIHAQPAGVASIVPRRKTDTDQEYQTRLHAHRQGLLTQRTEFVWAT
ncbi:recombinase family protein [Leifsonia xyli]|uniref:recombinase family protein n=1 Tax=Leifsonia xyli TaxID=1575 RepID=UPI001CB7D8A0|nr:recombinase family protein [Leifsonia xyli]